MLVLELLSLGLIILKDYKKNYKKLKKIVDSDFYE